MLTPAIFVLIYFWFIFVSGLALLLSLDFLFTRDYYISILKPDRNFSYNCNFFQLGIPSWNFNSRWNIPYNQSLLEGFCCFLFLLSFKTRNSQAFYKKQLWNICKIYRKTPLSVSLFNRNSYRNISSRILWNVLELLFLQNTS